MICEQEISDLKNMHMFITSNFKHGFKIAMERSGRTKDKNEKNSCFWVGNFMESFPNIKYSLENTSWSFETYFYKKYEGKPRFCHDLSISCKIGLLYFEAISKAD